MRHRRIGVIGIVVLVATLAGCASPAPAPAASSASDPVANTPAPIVEPAVATVLQFSGSDIRALGADSVEIDSVELSAGADSAVAFLSDAVGVAPAVSEETDEGCAGPHTRYQWAGLDVTAWTGSDDFVVGVSASTTGGIRLEATGGFAPGDDVSAFSASADPANVGSMGGANTLVAFDVVSRSTHGEYDSPVGAVGYSPDGVTLQSLVTPGEWSSFLC
jgi:hypothetical protein